MMAHYPQLDVLIEFYDRHPDGQYDKQVVSLLRELRSGLYLLDEIERKAGDAPHRMVSLAERIRVQVDAYPRH